jgi:hypothetical protein
MNSFRHHHRKDPASRSQGLLQITVGFQFWRRTPAPMLDRRLTIVSPSVITLLSIERGAKRRRAILFPRLDASNLIQVDYCSAS